MNTRRYFRFSLKTFLVFVLLCGVALVPLVWRLDKAREQREAVAQIERLRGRVYYDWQYDHDGERNHAPEPRPTWLRQRLGHDYFDYVHTVNLSHNQITDAGLVHLNGLTRLEMLDLTFTQITDAGLVHLKRLPRLKTLYLGYTGVTDSGVGHLKAMTTLEALYLYNTRITDAGVAELQKALPNCEIHK